jgi:hypothetical protein
MIDPKIEEIRARADDWADLASRNRKQIGIFPVTIRSPTSAENAPVRAPVAAQLVRASIVQKAQRSRRISRRHRHIAVTCRYLGLGSTLLSRPPLKLVYRRLAVLMGLS